MQSPGPADHSDVPTAVQVNDQRMSVKVLCICRHSRPRGLMAHGQGSENAGRHNRQGGAGCKAGLGGIREPLGSQRENKMISWQMLWRIIKSPTCWIRNYPTDKDYDMFIRYLVENRQKLGIVCAKRTNFRTVLRLANGSEFEFWTANQFHAYLSECYPLHGQCCLNRSVYGVMPSRSTAFLFYDMVEPMIPEVDHRSLGPKGYRSMLLLRDAMTKDVGDHGRN